jgi:hypothetical protein
MPLHPTLTAQLQLGRCPHCGVDTPLLGQVWRGETRDQAASHLRRWVVYACSRCGGLVTASAADFDHAVREVFPESKATPTDLPPRAHAYLEQAMASIHVPAGAVMLTASAIDAMLKAKGYSGDSLYTRIDKAAAENVITPDMARWAHSVRLDANDQRHADELADLPTEADAQRSIEFATTLATLLFTLPARVVRGLAPPPT